MMTRDADKKREQMLNVMIPAATIFFLLRKTKTLLRCFFSDNNSFIFAISDITDILGSHGNLNLFSGKCNSIFHNFSNTSVHKVCIIVLVLYLL